MKSMRKRLKKVLIICFIFSLLSNYISIMGEVFNIAYAAELDLKSTSIMDQLESNANKDAEDEETDKIDITVNESEEENIILDNTPEENVVTDNISSENVTSEDTIQDNISLEDENIDNSEKENISEEDKNLIISEESESIKNKLILDKNDALEDKKIEDSKVIENHLSPENKKENYNIQELEFNMNVSIDKLIKYNHESGKGVFLETTLKVEFDKNNKVIEEMILELDVPQIDEKLPENVQLENAETSSYDHESGKIFIDVENIQNLIDRVVLEYKLIFVYKDINAIDTWGINGIIKIKNTEESFEKEINCIVSEIQETTESFVQYTAKSDNSSIYKGYLKANVIAEQKYETPYDITQKVEIKNSDFVDVVVLKDTQEVLVQDNGQEKAFSSNYKKTAINVEIFNEMFADQGYIEIYTIDGRLLGTIDQESKTENDYYIFEYTENVNKVILKLVNPIKNGEIEIKNQKAIADTNVFTDDQVESFKEIKSSMTGQLIKNVNNIEVILQNVVFENKITLENTESRMKLELNNVDLSTEQENDVTISVTLKTNEQKYELFQNPTIDIEFPYSVEDVQINNVNLLYKNGLSIDSWNVLTNTVGERIIRVKLNGTQTGYTYGMLVDGTQVVIYVTVKVNRLTANGSSNIKLKYTNEVSTRVSYQLEGKEAEEYAINYVSKSGLIKATTFENFNQTFNSVTNFNNELNMASLDSYTESRTSKMSMTILNNHSTEISNVVILGRIPAVGNTDKDGNDLNTTIDTYLNREISISGIMSKIYYSYHVNAEKDDDSWQETVEDITKVKSYKIVIENETMRKGESISFDYDIVIPGDLDFNEKMYGVFSVYYNLNGENVVEDSIIGAETEEKELLLEDCQTTETIPETSLGIGTQVTLSGKVIEEETDVREGQILKYHVVLTNNGAVAINNIKLNTTVENGNMYWFKTYEINSSSTGEKTTTGEWIEDEEGLHTVEEFTIDSLHPGQSEEIYYQVVAKKTGEKIYGKIEVIADDIETKTIETIKNKVVEAKIKLSVTSGIFEDIENMYLTTGSPFKVVAKVKNISTEVLENITVNLQLPECMEVNETLTQLFYGIDVTIYQDRKGYVIETPIEKMEKDEEKELWYYVTIKNIDYSKTKEKISILATSVIDNEEYSSNDYVRDIYQTNTIFSAQYTANRENGSTVKDGDEIIYNLNVKNAGAVSRKIQIIDRLPYGLKVNEINLRKSDDSISKIKFENHYMSEWILIDPQQEINIQIIGYVDISDCRTDQMYIANIFELDEDLTEDTILEEISYKIEYPDGYLTKDETKGDSDAPLDNEILEDDDKQNASNNDNQIQEDNRQDSTNDDKKEELQNNEHRQEIPNNNVIENDNTANTPNEEIKNDQTIEEDIPNEIKQVKKYSISGYVWYDSDKNGLYNGEEKAKEVTVYLFKAMNSNIEQENLIATTKTDESGNYIFKDLVENNYIVIFSYDNTLYKATNYITTSGASINKSYIYENIVNIKGEEKKCGLSDVIHLTGNISNINAGLVSLNEFDMSIKTYLSSVTIVNSKENTTQQFEEDSKLNKIEIAAKYIEGTTITAKYKIKIINNGNISGYINQIVDTIPEGFEFNKDLNKNWSIGNDGRVYNSNLSNIEIKAGESKEITLILIKTLTGETTGVFKNKAEILNSTNTFQIKDEDTKNNTSETELIITVKTGITTYISIICIIIAIITIILIFINFKFNNRTIFTKRKFIFLLTGIIVLGFSGSIVLAENLNQYYWQYLSSMNVDNYLDGSLTLGNRFGPTFSGTELESNYKIQCIHSSDISDVMWTTSKARRFYADVQIGYSADKQNEVKYSYVSGGSISDALVDGDVVNEVNKLETTDGSEKDSKSQMIAYIAYLLEKGDLRGRGYLSSTIVQKCSTEWETWTSTGVPAVYTTALGSTSNTNTDITGISTALDNIDSFYSSNTNCLTVQKQTTTASYNGTYLGPFKATFPTGTACSNETKVYVDGVDYTANLYTNTTGTKAEIEDLYNTEFYIAYNANNTSKSKVAIKLENSHKYYKARILSAGFKGSGQFECVTRGKECSSTTNCTWTVELGCDVEVSKETIKVGSTTEVASNDTEKTYEIGDEVIFKITVTNDSGRTINMNLTDTFNTSQYEYVSVSGWNWTRAEDGQYIRNIDVGTSGETYYIKLKLKDDLEYTTDNKYTNTVVISNFKNNSIDTETITNKSGNTESSSAYAKCKKYKASINKYIVGITDQTISGRDSSKSATLYAEPGDEVTFVIDIRNTVASNDVNYGKIKDVSFVDTWDNGEYVTDIKYSSEQNGTYGSSLPTNWSKTENIYKYTGQIDKNSYAKLYIKCTVNKSKTNVTVTNSVAITEINNKNDIDIYNTNSAINKMESITNESSDAFIIKKYALNITKVVNKISYPLDKTTGSTSQAEVGDFVEYKITIKNTGTNANLYGKIYEINLADYFDNRYLNIFSINHENIDLSGGGGQRDGNTTTYTYTYKNASGLATQEEMTFYVTLKVINPGLENLTDDKVVTNTAEIKLGHIVKNKNDVDIRDVLDDEIKDTAEVEILSYKLKVHKDINYTVEYQENEYGGVSGTGTKINHPHRNEKTNEQKYDDPVKVERYDLVNYKIKIENCGETEINGFLLKDSPDDGLEFFVEKIDINLYKYDEEKKKFELDHTEKVDPVKNDGDMYINFDYNLNPKDYFVFEIQCVVDKTNLYLFNLENKIEIVSDGTNTTENRNGIDLISENLISFVENENKDYVRLKDLVVSGTVWQDTNRNGIMNDDEQKLEGITVNLRDARNNKVATTTTNSDGYYIFSETNGKDVNGNDTDKAMVLSDGRVVKATNRDPNTGNYERGKSEYIDYYVEFEYNGTQYKSSPNYKSDQNIKSNGSYQKDYLTDSNAAEFDDVREAFKNKLETICYNEAFGKDEKGNTSNSALSYTKDGHESKIDKTEATTMKAQSFIYADKEALDPNGIEEGDIKYLWLYQDGETEYLKYINLGLETQTVDLKLEQDVYEIKTTINGEETTYAFNQAKEDDSEYSGEYVTGGETNPKNYEFEIYNSDYYYESSQYQSEVVKEYKQNTELDIEVTYKITITNENVGDGRKTYAVIKELVNYYDDTFVRYTDNTRKTIKEKDENGLLVEYTDRKIVSTSEGSIDKFSNYISGKGVKEGYQRLYIKNLDNHKLAEGESFDLYITFTVDKYTTSDINELIGHLILGEKNNIVEINAYSIYEEDGTPSGYIDRDSNPGNWKYLDSTDDIAQYEDDTYKTGINLLVNNINRTQEGIVWEDTRSVETYGQYVGNGINTIESKEDKKRDQAESNSDINEKHGLMGGSEIHDIPVEGVKVQMIELIPIAQGEGDERTVSIYQEIIKPSDLTINETRSDSEGKYTLRGFIPGSYITQFTYGDTTDENMLLYNGQDYKSTTFKLLNEIQKEELDDQKAMDQAITTKIEEPNWSDAIDDEIRRLEVMRYSEIVNNEKLQVSKEKNVEEFVQNTYMNAETYQYSVTTEKAPMSQKYFSFAEILEILRKQEEQNRYAIKNVDFGLQYRPETKIELNKYISNINVTLANGTKIFDIVYDNIYKDNDDKNIIIGTQLNKEKSKGADSYQFLPTQNGIKGIGYLNMDRDILQGATVKITYLFVANNLSEIDDISIELYDLRYKRDSEKQYHDATYTASGTARNILFEDYYGTDEYGILYRKQQKFGFGHNNYWGRYLGNIYYYGSSGVKEKTSEVKIDKILDYVDTDLTFDANENNDVNNYWQIKTSRELYQEGLMDKTVFVDGYLLDQDGRRFDTDNNSNLVVSVDDKKSEADNTNKNILLSKFLKPQSESDKASFGTIKLVTSKVVGSDEDTDDMVYDNTAEILQYTTLSGRTTNLEQTVGNLNLRSDEDENEDEDKNLDEPDTDFTETISLIPPTGSYTLKYHMYKHKNIIITIGIVALGISIIWIGINKIRHFKKRYK